MVLLTLSLAGGPETSHHLQLFLSTTFKVQRGPGQALPAASSQWSFLRADYQAQIEHTAGTGC